MVTEELRRLARLRLEDYDRGAASLADQLDPDLTHPAAYELQGEVVRLRELRGEHVIGFKVGCTSRPIQEQLGTDGPIFGRLFDTACHRSGARLSYARYANLAIEGELAVRLCCDLDGRSSLSREECLGAIESVFPVIELHNFVLHRDRPSGPELIASNGMHAGFVLAETESSGSGRPDFAFGLTIRINDVVVDSVDDSGRVVDPLDSLSWLAGRLAGLGLRLSKGQVILTGSPMRLLPVIPGDRVVVDATSLGKSEAEILH